MKRQVLRLCAVATFGCMLGCPFMPGDENAVQRDPVPFALDDRKVDLPVRDRPRHRIVQASLQTHSGGTCPRNYNRNSFSHSFDTSHKRINKKIFFFKHHYRFLQAHPPGCPL